MKREKGGREEEAEEECMRCHRRTIARQQLHTLNPAILLPFLEKTRPTTMKAFLALLLAPLALALSTHDKLTTLAKQGDGIIKLDQKSFDLLTSSKRNWSASIHLTALDKRRKCTPCRSLFVSHSLHEITPTDILSQQGSSCQHGTQLPKPGPKYHRNTATTTSLPRWTLMTVPPSFQRYPVCPPLSVTRLLIFLSLPSLRLQ